MEKSKKANILLIKSAELGCSFSTVLGYDMEEIRTCPRATPLHPNSGGGLWIRSCRIMSLYS